MKESLSQVFCDCVWDTFQIFIWLLPFKVYCLPLLELFIHIIVYILQMHLCIELHVKKEGIKQ